MRFLIVASYHLLHICERLANSTAARRREGQGALMRRRMSLKILGVSPGTRSCRLRRGGGWTEADRACCSYRMHAEPRMDQTRCSGHSVSGTHGLADQLNARSHQMTLGRLNRVLRPHAHEMHISYAWPPLFYGKTTELWLFLSELYTTLAICRQHATTKSACEPLLKPNVCLTFWVYL